MRSCWMRYVNNSSSCTRCRFISVMWGQFYHRRVVMCVWFKQAFNGAVWRLQWASCGCPEDRSPTAADSTRAPPASSLCAPPPPQTKRSSGCARSCARGFCGLSHWWGTSWSSSTCTRECACARGLAPRTSTCCASRFLIWRLLWGSRERRSWGAKMWSHALLSCESHAGLHRKSAPQELRLKFSGFKELSRCVHCCSCCCL